MSDATDQPAVAIIRALEAAGVTVATAESLTGGLVCAALTAVPGSSAVVRGGVAAYATDVKETVLGVDTTVLNEYGAVSERTAVAMARGARRVMSADVGVATTGVAGPDLQDGEPAGTVYVAVATATDVVVESRTGVDRLVGGRREVREQTVDLALSTLASVLDHRES